MITNELLIKTVGLEKKFSDFGTLVKDNKLATMQLSKDEVNLAIAHFEKLAEFKDTDITTFYANEDSTTNDAINEALSSDYDD